MSENHSTNFIKSGGTTLTGVAQLVGCHPVKQRVTGSIPSQGTRRGCGFVRQSRVHMRGNQLMPLYYIIVSLPIFLLPFPSL